MDDPGLIVSSNRRRRHSLGIRIVRCKALQAIGRLGVVGIRNHVAAGKSRRQHRYDRANGGEERTCVESHTRVLQIDAQRTWSGINRSGR